MIVVNIPGLRLESEANKRDKWKAIRRAKIQRHTASMWVLAELEAVGFEKPPWPEIAISIARIGVRALDSDNLARSAKSLRDGIADAIGVDDGDPRVVWRYSQERGKPREYGVRITIEPRTHECTCKTCGRGMG